MRHVATIEIYVHGEKADAEKEAELIAEELRKKYDNHAQVTNITQQEFASLTLNK